MSRRPLTDDEVMRAIADLPAWSRVGNGLVARAEFPSFPLLISAVDDIAVAAEKLDHHPDLDIRWRTLLVRLTTHEPFPDRQGGPALTELDIAAEHQITTCVHASGGTLLSTTLTPDPLDTAP